MRKRHRRWSDLLVEVDGGFERSTIVYAAGHAGSGARWADELTTCLPEQWGVCALLLPGREARSREPFATGVDAVAESAAGEIAALQPPGLRAVLYGQSLGALVAFEVCRRLERDGVVRPLALAVLGAPAPVTRLPRSTEITTDDELMDDLASFGSVPDAVLGDRGLRELVLEVLRNDVRLFDSYGWGTRAKVAAPIVTLRGVDDSRVTRSSVEAWRECTRSDRFCHAEIAGAHLPTRRAAETWVDFVRRLDER